MAGQTTYLVFDFPDGRLTDHAPILRLMGRIVEGDRFQFLKKAIVCDDSPGDIYVPNSPETLANAWRNAMRAAARYNGYWMEFEDDEAFRLAFGFDPNEPRRLFLSVRTSSINRPTDAARVRELARIAELIYETLSPHYGFGFFSYEMHELPEPGSPVAALWDYNFFSPALVEQFGRDRLLALPAWRHAELPDGGLFLEMTPNPIAEWQPYVANYREAAAALGVNKFYQGG